MNALLKPTTTVGTPLAFLNIFGGIVAGIWLAVLGEWGAIGWGIAAIVLATCGMSIAFLPAVGLGAMGGYFAERGHTLLFTFFAFLSSFYTVGTIALWCGLALYFFASLADAGSVIPLLLWSYGIATGPFAWVAAKEGNDDFASLTATFSDEDGDGEHRRDRRSDSPTPRLTCMPALAGKHVMGRRTSPNIHGREPN
jgi:hypothetical protein